MSGPAIMTVRSGASVPLKSGTRTSAPMPGHLRRGGGGRVRAAVGEVVAGDAGHDDMLEPHHPDRLRHPARLVLVVPGRAPGLDGAEAAGAGAGIAQDHDRRRALIPALADVGAACLFAHGVEREIAKAPLTPV